CTPNFLIQEHVTLGEGYLKQPFEVVDGHIAVPAGPGLGIEVDEDALQEHLFDGDWDTPAFALDDQSVAEW
ncbi:MAG: enolase C-terminal domain-like protein, partial [Phycisphaeraceae bacterium]